MAAFIRRAKPEDAAHIIVAHVTSIRELCTKDYTPEQIRAWAGRDFSTERWKNRILNDWLWVVEKDGFVEGMVYLRKETDEIAYLDGLYFTPKVTGQGFAQEAMKLVIEEAKKNNFKTIELQATLTSLKFYLKCGFVVIENGKKTYQMGNVEIPAIEMKMSLV